MTRMEMRGWINEQISAGKMTLDESTAFVGMTIGAEIDNSPVNFVRKVKDGIEAAVWRNQSESQAMWEKAWSVIERYQLQGSINTYA